MQFNQTNKNAGNVITHDKRLAEMIASLMRRVLLIESFLDSQSGRLDDYDAFVAMMEKEAK